MSNMEVLLMIIVPLSIPIFICLLLLWIKQIPEWKQKQFKNTMIEHICETQSEEEFKNIYHQILNNIDIDIIKRKHIKNTIVKLLMYIILFSLIFIILFLLLIAPLIFKNEINEFIIYLAIFMLLIIVIVMSCFIEKQDNKNQVIKNLILAVDANIKYKEVEESIYVVRELCDYAGFRDKFNLHKLTDYMEYELPQNTKVKLADVFLRDKPYRGAAVNIFEGITTKISREKLVTNEILIERNRQFKAKNNIVTDGEFEKIFDLSAVNKEDAEIRINAHVRNQIVQIYKQYGIMFEISLKGNFIYVRFYTGDLFDDKLFVSIVNEKKLHREYVILKSILEIIEKLNDIL